MNGGGLCAVCGARQGPPDPAIGLPRCRGELAHVMYYHVPMPTIEAKTGVPRDTVLFKNLRTDRLVGAITNLGEGK